MGDCPRFLESPSFGSSNLPSCVCVGAFIVGWRNCIYSNFQMFSSRNEPKPECKIVTNGPVVRAVRSGDSMNSPSYYPKLDECDHCGYSMVGIQNRICPECGKLKEIDAQFDLITHRGSARASSHLYAVATTMWLTPAVLVPISKGPTLSIVLVALIGLLLAGLAYMSFRESKSGVVPDRIRTSFSILSFFALLSGIVPFLYGIGQFIDRFL